MGGLRWQGEKISEISSSQESGRQSDPSRQPSLRSFHAPTVKDEKEIPKKRNEEIEVDRQGLQQMKTSIRRYDAACCALGLLSMILSPIQVS